MSASEIALPSPREKNPLERFLSLFSVVRAGEGATVVLLWLNVFLLLGSYYILKVVRDATILGESGAEVKSYSAAGQAVLLLLFLPAYGAFATKVNRVRLVSWATLFFVSHLAVFYLFGRAGFRTGIAFYLWLGIFNNFVVAQFWAFANDLYSEEQGKRLFPIVGVGASLGAWVGTAVVTRVFRRFSAYELMVMAGGVLIVCVLLTLWVHLRESKRQEGERARVAREPLGKEGGFHLVLKNRYLRLIAILIVLLNVVNTTGGFMLDKSILAEAEQRVASGQLAEPERGAFLGETIGGIYSWVNLLGLLTQMFLVSRLFRYLGVRGAIFVLPSIALGGYALLAAMPLFHIIRTVKIAENSTDYSLQNTIRAALFLPTSREAKYKAKAAIDTFFARFGDMLQAGVVLAGTSLGLTIAGFALTNAILAAVWIAVAVAIHREHKKLAREA